MASPNTVNFDTFERLAESLEGFVSENGHYRAMCPAHDGNRPALTISVEGEPPNRKILLHCHASCGKQEILDALGLSKRDLFERPRTKADKGPPIVATYNYVDLAGNLVTQTTRHEPKDFRQRRPDGNGGWIWSIKGIEPVLYNLPAVMRTVMDGGTVFVVEGEKDCDRANEVLKDAGTFTTCPMGSGKWRDSYTQTLRGANVVLIPDNDGPGKKHQSQVGGTLVPVAKSVKLLELPGVPEDGGDLSDWLDTGGTVDEFNALLKSEACIYVTPDALPVGSDANKSFPAFTVGEIKTQSSGENEQEWFCPLFMKAGEITLIGGEAKKSGKTTLVMHMLKAVHDGVPFMGMPTLSANSLVLTEQGNNILEATNKAGIQDDDQILITPYKDVSKEDWPVLINLAVQHCKENNLGILVIDTFTAFAKLRGSDENLSGEVIERMEPILEAARVHGLHVSLLHHTGYNGEIRGSSAFWKDPDTIWTIKKPPGDHEPNVRAMHGAGRYDAVNTTFNIALEESGYTLLGTNNQIERSKAKNALLSEIPQGRQNARRRTEVFKSLSDVASEPTLRRALEDLIDARAVQEVGLKGKGNPKVLWRSDLFTSNPRGMGSEADVNKSDVGESAYLSQKHEESFKSDPIDIGEQITPEPVDTLGGVAVILKALESAEKVALDLETMPPEGWVWEVADNYRSWRKKLKNRPKKERMRKVWDEYKEKVYKKYAVNPETAQVRLISLATDTGINETIDAPAVGDLGQLLEVLREKTLIMHNASFDLGVLRERFGYIHNGPVLDTQLLYLLLHYARDGERSEVRDGKNRLPDPVRTKVQIGEKMVTMSSLLAVASKYLPGTVLDKAQQSEDWSVPDLSQEMISYSLQDSQVLLPLSEVLLERLEEIGMGDVVHQIEARTVPAKVWMERNGFPASREAAEKMGVRYQKEAEKALRKLTDLLEGISAPDKDGWSWTNPAHVRAALEGLGVNLEKLDKTDKSGEPATSRAALQKITKPAAAVEWVEAFLEHKDLRKRSSDFVDKYAELVRENGTIPGSFETISTGRFNCTKPNLQQVPGRGEIQTREGMRIRDIFRTRPGQSLVVADFEQVELLLAATIAERRGGVPSKMLEVFRTKGSDIHRATAAWVMGKPASKVTKAERSLAKAINFGLIYGCSAEKLLESATTSYGVEGMTLKDAKRYRKAFFEKYPEFVTWHRKVRTDCENGIEYATTPRGKGRKLPTWSKSGDVAFTTAVNHPVQGAGADAIKLTLAKLFEDRHNCPGHPDLNCTVHDEVILSVKTEHAEAAKAWVEKHMADAEREAVMDPDSPIAVEVEVQDSWGGG